MPRAFLCSDCFSNIFKTLVALSPPVVPAFDIDLPSSLNTQIAFRLDANEMVVRVNASSSHLACLSSFARSGFTRLTFAIDFSPLEVMVSERLLHSIFELRSYFGAKPSQARAGVRCVQDFLNFSRAFCVPSGAGLDMTINCAPSAEWRRHMFYWRRRHSAEDVHPRCAPPGMKKLS